MITISNLAETLCGAMGLRPDLGSMSIEYLTEHDMLEGGDAKAEPSHAAGLLIALAGSGEMCAQHKTVLRFWNLPLISATMGLITGELYGAYKPVDEDDPFVLPLRERDARFGDVLADTISDYAFYDEMAIQPGNITLGFGPGLTRADMTVLPAPPEIPNNVLLFFGTGESMLPDDAAPARLERWATVPASIFDVLREALSGATEPPAVSLAARSESGQIIYTPTEDL